MYKGLGLATFSLDSIANIYRPTELTLQIKQASVTGGVVEITVTPKFLGEVYIIFLLLFIHLFIFSNS